MDGEELLDLDMKQFRQEKHEKVGTEQSIQRQCILYPALPFPSSTLHLFSALSTLNQVVESVDDFLESFECVASFSQDKKEPNSIVVPGCPPLLDWAQMEAEEGEITLVRQAENAPELNTTDSIFKSVSICSPDLDLSKVMAVLVVLV